MTVLLGGPGKRCVVLMNQSSRDYTLLDVRPSPGPGRGAVSPQSSRDKRRKRSLPGSTVRREGRAISAVMAVLDFHGDSAELAARYDKAVHDVVAVSSARPLVHLAVPREYGFMVVDVWTSEEALRAFDENPELRRVLREAGMPEFKLRIYPVHNLGWPVEAMPLYR